MNIEKLARQSLQYLTTNQSNFPKSGIIAGGSLANLIWEQVSGNVAVINDIDIFIFQNKIDLDSIGQDSTSTNDKKKAFYRSQEKIYWKDYTGLCEGSKTKDFYLIETTENSGLFNYIYYSSTSESPELVIDSFDINCTQIGYDIKTDRFFWTKDFEDFLKTGELKLTNLGSPHHSVIRIIKKRDELNAKLDELEIKIAAFAIHRPLHGITRRYFSDKYYHIFRKYEEELKEYFIISKELEISSLIKESRGIEIGIYTLLPQTAKKSIFENSEVDKDAKLKIWNCNDFLFYIRNIQSNPNLQKIWSKLQPLFSYNGYIDFLPNDEDVDLLSRIIYNIPNSIKNLQGYRISEQIHLVKKLFEKYKDDLTIAFSILENKKIDPSIVLDDQTSLLLELSVRFEIVNVKYDVDKILGLKDSTFFINEDGLPF